MANNCLASTDNMHDLPPNYYKDYEEIIALLKTTMDEIINKHTYTSLTFLTERFISFYQSFYCEKEVFDSLNICKLNDDPIYEHSVNVALLSRMLGDLNHMHSSDLNSLTQAALLHDIGKLLVDQDILHKDGTLTTKEFNLIKKHTKFGHKVLFNLFDDPRIAAVALMHHERCDGSGYPTGAKSANLNEFTRIVAICDVYSGMVASRKYRESRCPFEIIRMFEREGLQKYDTDYTILFLRSMLDTYIGYKVKLTSNEIGYITSINPLNLSNPTVQVNNLIVDLSKDKRDILHII
ncbi:MAG: HD domain-containing protein [Lachnospiraceae bacterium]|nr:HD domain-containing protein [Lachnospiraceae bacterium]